jgi:hypothetical protein
MKLVIRPDRVQAGGVVTAEGSGWPLDAIAVSIGKDKLPDKRVLCGSLWRALIVPHLDGTFLFNSRPRA